MGYTHYWELKKELTTEEVAKVAFAVNAIVETSDVLIDGDETFSSKVLEGDVSLNGAESLGEDYETFCFSAKPEGFRFCKTAVNPYDEVVVAILMAIKHLLPETFNWYSDGCAEDGEHREGLDLLNKSGVLTVFEDNKDFLLTESNVSEDL